MSSYHKQYCQARRDYVHFLHTSCNATYTEIAKRLGVSRTRVSQIISEVEKPEPRISVRARSCVLNRANIPSDEPVTDEQILNLAAGMTDAELLRTRNFGRKSLNELRALQKAALALDPDAQLVLDLIKYLTATEGKILPPECGATPGTKGCRQDRLERAFCAVQEALERAKE